MPSTTSQLVATARARSTRAMTEPEAKAWLAQQGVPMPESRLARSADEATQLAQRLGFPVVLKIVSADVLHKSDAGGVRVGLASADEVRGAYAEVLAAVHRRLPSARIEGLLVERMAPRGHEFIVGVQRDPVFGPTLLVGAGGILVELVRDVSLRVLPIREHDAHEMLAELRASKLLDGFRGVPPGDRAALVRLLLAIGGPDGLVARAGADLAEMDLNPVLVHPEGLSIVDARVIVTPEPQPVETPAGLPNGAAAEAVRAKFQPVFYPRGVVIVGASTDETKMGSRAVRNVVEYGFKGPVYPINPRAKEVYGARAYPSISAIPGQADRAVVAIPAEAVPGALVELAGKGVKVAQVLTAGYSEAGPEGREMERD
ncbi:MAG: acetate--CoA ligase family protein, partial [Chloroflexi bacterium]|nr:acetate--CoA ligase family protein [Chloroflexota bacterium]